MFEGEGSVTMYMRCDKFHVSVRGDVPELSAET